jgi:fatty-acyl-CoA synthase
VSRTAGRLMARIRQGADRYADAPALTFLDSHLTPTTYTSRQLMDAADAVAARLERSAIDRSSPLGILLRSQEAQVLHYLGALAAGVVPAILTPPNRKVHREYYAQTMSAVLARSAFTAVITDLEDIAAGYPALAPHTLAATGAPRDVAHDDGDRLSPTVSFMQFSSGTTGIKRGVLVTDEAVLRQLDTYAAALRLARDDVIISWLPLYHDMGFIACLNMPLVFGVHTIMLDPIDWVTNPALYLRAASNYRATLAWNPNFAYAFMAQRVTDRHLDGVDLSSLRALVNCSEPVTHESQQLFAERFGPRGLRPRVFTGCYAMAETVFALTHGDPDDPVYLDPEGPAEDARRDGSRPYLSVGRPLPGVELRVVSEKGDPLPDRAIGELWVRSPFNLAGYYRNPEATTAAFHGDWYRTGDLGYRLGEAYYVVGRKKDVIIVSGVNVFPQDVEDLVGQVNGVQPGRVSAFADFDERQQTERVIVLAESHLEGEEAREVLVAARQRIQAAFSITGFKVHLVGPGWLVKSTSGKMARGANRDKWKKQDQRNTVGQQVLYLPDDDPEATLERNR